MIPQERVNEAAKEYAKQENFYEPDLTRLEINEFAENCFQSGVRFAESEPQSKPTTSAEAKQKLFNYFAEQHGIQLMDSDFNEIQEYMKPGLQYVATEFAEWKELNGWKRSLRRDLISWYQEGNAMLDKPFKHATTSELYAKFEAERNSNKNGG